MNRKVGRADKGRSQLRGMMRKDRKDNGDEELMIIRT